MKIIGAEKLWLRRNYLALGNVKEKRAFLLRFSRFFVTL